MAKIRTGWTTIASHLNGCSRGRSFTQAYIWAALALVAIGLVPQSVFAGPGLVSASAIEHLDVHAGEPDASTRLLAIGGTRTKAIGGTRAKAIGGTRAKAIGGTRAKAIGGTRAKAIGGTRAKAIGGTRAKAIGGTRAKAIGGTRAKGVAFSYALANLNDADAESYFFSSAELDADSSTSGRPLDRLVWNEMSYDWLIVGPAQVNSVGDTVSLPGVEADIPASNISTVSDAIASGEMLAILGYSDSKAVTVVPTGMPFIDGSTEIVFVGQVQSRSSDGTLTLANGLSVDTSGLREGTLEALSVGTWISVRGTYFSGM